MAHRTVAGAFLRLTRRPTTTDVDADLLGRFVRDRDGEAFAGLVRRHGPMVLGVCRRTLGPGPDADDAFQATFLVLVGKAKAVSPPGAVGPWLYGVAARTAARARVQAARRRGRQRGLTDVPDPRSSAPGRDDLAAVIDAELARLPDKYRAAVVLCELDGKSLKEAAALLGVPPGTVASRLARGRKLLAGRLAGRGLAVPAGGLTAWFAGQVQAHIPGPLAEATAAVAGAASPAGSPLASGVVKVMLAHKLKAAGRAVVAAGMIGVGAMAMTGPAAVSAPPERPAARRNTAPVKPDPAVLARLLDGWWAEMEKGEQDATRAVLAMAAHPREAVPFLRNGLPPLKLTREQVKVSLVDLDSDKEAVWKPTFERLTYLDPRVAADVETLLVDTPGDRGRRRLAAALLGDAADRFDGHTVACRQSTLVEQKDGRAFTVLVDVIWVAPDTMPGGKQPVKNGHPLVAISKTAKPTWTRAVRAVALLEHIGTPDAVAVLKDMATGHPDAQPTKAAKDALARLEPPR